MRERLVRSSHVHPIFPGKNACLQCTGVFSKNKTETERAEASHVFFFTYHHGYTRLASSYEETLKILLKFGEVQDYISYNALMGTFTHILQKKTLYVQYARRCDPRDKNINVDTGFIKSHAKAYKKEVYGWLVGYEDKQGNQFVISTIPCQRYIEQEFAHATPDPIEFQEIGSFLPQGLGNIGMSHRSIRIQSFILERMIRLLRNFSKMYPNMISGVTDGK